MANAAQCDTYLPQKARAVYVNYNSVVTMITPSGIHCEGRAMWEGKDGEPKTRNLEPVKLDLRLKHRG